MLKNALYLDKYFIDECNNKTNYLLVVDRLESSDPTASSSKCISYNNMEDVGSLIGDQLLINTNLSISVKKTYDELIKTVLISSLNDGMEVKNIFKVIYSSDNFTQN